MSNAIIPGSLTAVTRRNKTSLAESFLDAEMVVLVDTSGSMDSYDAPGNQQRYKAACDQLERLQAQNPGKIAVISFSSQVYFCPNGIPTYQGITTDMAAALQFVQPVDDTGTKIVLISDGSPDSEEQTLAVARKFKTAVDTIFIGPESDTYGREFLHRLAQSTGGQFFKSEAPAQLESSVEQLLLIG